MGDSYRMVKDQMSELEFHRWKTLMRQIEDVEKKRKKLSSQIDELRPKINELYLEMQLFWKRLRAKEPK